MFQLRNPAISSWYRAASGGRNDFTGGYQKMRFKQKNPLTGVIAAK